jgi:hypothetical protein
MNHLIALALINDSDFYRETAEYRDNLIKRIAKQCYIESLAVKGLNQYVKYAPLLPWYKQYYPGVKLSKLDRDLISQIILDHWLGDYLIETPQPSESEIKAKIKRVKAFINRAAKFMPITN